MLSALGWVLHGFDSCIFCTEMLWKNSLAPKLLAPTLKPPSWPASPAPESRRWTVGELFERLKNLGLHCSKPALLAALGELELEIAYANFFPGAWWNRAPSGAWPPKSELLALLSGVRSSPWLSAGTDLKLV
jgi:hypothetical protein